MMSVLRDILVPLAFAALIAILLNPLTNRFERKMPKIVSIMLAMIIGIVVVVAILYFLSSQVAH